MVPLVCRPYTQVGHLTSHICSVLLSDKIYQYSEIHVYLPTYYLSMELPLYGKTAGAETGASTPTISDIA